jgi:hypothetical protein
MKPEELVKIAKDLLDAGYEKEADDVISLIPEEAPSSDTEDHFIFEVLNDLAAHKIINLDTNITATEAAKIENSLRQFLLHPIMS